MHGNPTSRRTQRAIVLQLLNRDHLPDWSSAELAHEVAPLNPAAISDALSVLERERVIVITGEQVQASPCARHLDRLDLIGV